MKKKWTAEICTDAEERARLERIAELAECIRANDKEVNLDFREPGHREFFMLHFGGEEYFRHEFPEFYGVYEKSVLDAFEAQGTAEYTDSNSEREFHDAAQIIYFYRNEEDAAILQTETALKNNSEMILESFKMYDVEAEKLIWSNKESTYNSHVAKRKQRLKNSADRWTTGPILCDYFSAWVDPRTRGIKTCLYSLSAEKAITGSIEKFEMTNPIHKNTPADSAIVVCYNRHSSSGEGVDYDDYDEAFDPETGKQRLYLDVSGIATVKEDQRPFQWIDPTDFVLKLVCDSGFAEYNLEGRQQDLMKSFKQTDTGFSFALDKDWQGIVPAGRLPIVEDVDFLLRFNVMTAKSKAGILVSSDLDPSEVCEDRILISKLHLLWGCVEEHTIVLMADGSPKQIKDVEIGDKVMTLGGSACAVRDTIHGREKRLLCIKTADGQELLCSKEHPILTTKRMKLAYMLKGDDILIQHGNRPTKIISIYETSGGEVCSLLLEPDGVQEPAILTNGLFTGDFTVQNAVMKRVKAEAETDSNRQPGQETLKLLEYFKGADL